jgi:hypothetical protein
MGIEAGSSTYYQAKRGIVQDGLVLHLDAGVKESYGGAGNTWYDLSGNDNHSTLANGPEFNRSAGGSISFDGTNDYVYEISALNTDYFQNNWTISFWSNWSIVNTVNTHVSDRPLLQYGQSSVRRGIHLTSRSSRFHYGLYSNDRQSTAIMVANTWYNSVFTLDNSSLNRRLYINGSLDFSDTIGGQFLGTGTNAKIGGVSLFGLYFSGQISVCLFYNRVLSDVEITQNYNATRHRFGI